MFIRTLQCILTTYTHHPQNSALNRIWACNTKYQHLILSSFIPVAREVSNQTSSSPSTSIAEHCKTDVCPPLVPNALSDPPFLHPFPLPAINHQPLRSARTTSTISTSSHVPCVMSPLFQFYLQDKPATVQDWTWW